MRRIPVLLGVVALCGLFVGCGGENRDYLVTQTVNTMNEAASATDGVSEAVAKSLKKADGDKNKLDLADAMKATEPLKETGTKLQKMKQATENLRGTITEAERENNTEEYRNKITGALGNLTAAKDKLQTVLAQSEKLNSRETAKLRAKIREAEAPFEAVARQQ